MTATTKEKDRQRANAPVLTATPEKDKGDE